MIGLKRAMALGIVLAGLSGLVMVVVGLSMGPNLPSSSGTSWPEYVSSLDSYSGGALPKEAVTQAGVGLVLGSAVVALYSYGLPPVSGKLKKAVYASLAAVGLIGFLFFGVAPWVRGGGFRPLYLDAINQLVSTFDAFVSSTTFGFVGFCFLTLAFVAFVAYWATNDGLRRAAQKAILYVAGPLALLFTVVICVFDPADLTNHAMMALAPLEYGGVYLVSNLTVLVVASIVTAVGVFDAVRSCR